jgi:hypothetical protein
VHQKVGVAFASNKSHNTSFSSGARFQREARIQT